MKQCRGRRWISALSLVAALLIAGCGDNGESPLDPDPGPDPYDGIPVELTSPDAVIASVAMAWTRRNLAAMGALLAPDFEFHVRGDEAAAFPWLPQGWWGRSDELGIAANMFDPAFAGANPPVQSVEFVFNILLRRDLGNGATELTADALITVLTGPSDGWASDTRFLFIVEGQPDGFLRLAEMREVLKLDPGRGTGTGMEASTWASVKGLYLTDPDPYQGIPVELTSPSEVVASVERAWEYRNEAALDALLAPDFEFHFRDDAAADFPWAPQGFWDRGVELGMAANMFDPGFTGAVPPVQSIDVQVTILSIRVVPSGDEVMIDAVVTVLTGPASGWSSDTRFVLVIEEQTDGFLRLAEMQEVLKLEPRRGAASSAEETSWGQIKGLYR